MKYDKFLFLVNLYEKILEYRTQYNLDMLTKFFKKKYEGCSQIQAYYLFIYFAKSRLVFSIWCFSWSYVFLGEKRFHRLRP